MIEARPFIAATCYYVRYWYPIVVAELEDSP